MSRFLSYVMYSFSLAAWLASFSGWLTTLDWRLELLSHLLPLYALGVLPGLLWSLWRRHWWLSGVFAAALLLILSPLLPLYWAPGNTGSGYGREVRVTHFNVDRRAKDHTQAFAMLRDSGDDVLLLQEVTPPLAQQLSRTLPNYRMRLLYPRFDSAGSALMIRRDSDLQLDQLELVTLPENAERRLISAHLRLEGRDIRLLSLHVSRSVDAESSGYQVDELNAVAQWAIERQEKYGEAVLIVGDFNATPWSRRFQQLLQKTGLRNGQLGYGLQGTWPNWSPLPLLPIDLCLLSPQLTLTHYTTSDGFLGDHRALHIRFQIASYSSDTSGKPS